MNGVKVGDVVRVSGHRWRVTTIHGRIPYEWAWLVRCDKPMIQCRLSLAADEFKQTASGGRNG